MASQKDYPINVVGNASDTEWEEEGAEGDVEQTAEEGEEQTRLPRGSWEGSYITQADINRLRWSRRIPKGVLTRVPLVGQIEPEPEEGEYVVFAAHFNRGFALPVNNFTKKFLGDFKLQPHHLPANAILTMSTFVTFSEAYVGVVASLRAWAKYFQFARQTVPKTKITVQCGAASVTPRKGSIFPRITGLMSCKKWQRSWFYVKNQEPKVDLIGLPKFKIGPPPTKDNNWDYNPDLETDEEEIEELKLINTALVDLLAEGMTGDDLLQAFTDLRVNPLQKRTHKMCHLSGPLDPNRMSTFELSKGSVFRRVKAIARTSMTSANWQWGKEPYNRHNQAPVVSTIQPNHRFILAETVSHSASFAARDPSAQPRGREAAPEQVGKGPAGARFGGTASGGGHSKSEASTPG